MVLLSKLLDKLLVLVHLLKSFNIHVIKTDLLSLQTEEYTTSDPENKNSVIYSVQRFKIQFQTMYRFSSICIWISTCSKMNGPISQ